MARDLRLFLKAAWHTIEPATPFVDGWYIGAICEHLQAVSEGEIQNLLILVPPGTAKSTIVSVMFPAWEWVRRPHLRFLCASYDLKLAQRDGAKCGDVVRSEWFQSLFEDRFELLGDARILLETDHFGRRGCYSPASGTTGWRGDRLIIDDPHDVRAVESDVERNATLHWHDTTWYNRVNDANTSRRVVMGQRTHVNDLQGHLLKGGGYEVLRLPEEYSPKLSAMVNVPRRLDQRPLTKDPRTQEGQLLRPERMDETRVAENKRRLGPIAWSAQHQQDPIPAGGGLYFQAADFRYFELAGDDDQILVVHDAPGKSRRFLRSMCISFQAFDMACKGAESPTADFVGDGTFFLTPEADLCWADLLHQKMTGPEMKGALFAELTEWKPDYVLMESNGMQLAIVQQAIADGLPARRWHADKNKETTAMTVSALVREHKVFMRAGASWVDDAQAQLLAFPKVEHDDIVTVLSIAGIEAYRLAMLRAAAEDNANALKVRQTQPTDFHPSFVDSPRNSGSSSWDQLTGR